MTCGKKEKKLEGRMTTSSPPFASALLQIYSCSCPKLPTNGFLHIPSLLHFSTLVRTTPSLHHSSLLLVRASSEPELGLVETPSEPVLLEDGIDVEEEIYEFMMQSDNPELFPTKEELLAAGREDLVDAMSGQGGWLVLGWDMDDDENEINGGGAPAAEEAPNSSGRFLRPSFPPLNIYQSMLRTTFHLITAFF